MLGFKNKPINFNQGSDNMQEDGDIMDFYLMATWLQAEDSALPLGTRRLSGGKGR